MHFGRNHIGFIPGKIQNIYLPNANLNGGNTADNCHLNKYHTRSIHVCCYQFKSLHFDQQFFLRSLITSFGLITLSCGCGLVKPCSQTIGGDQFDLPAQNGALLLFYSLFEMSIRCGQVLGILLTPMLKECIQCFDQEDCYSLAYGFTLCTAAIAYCNSLSFIQTHSIYKKCTFLLSSKQFRKLQPTV